MNLMTFKYTDAKGKESLRELLVMSAPSDKYTGIDISPNSDTAPEDAVDFAVEYDELQRKFTEDIMNLKNKYDLRHSYRQFFADKMENVCLSNL